MLTEGERRGIKALSSAILRFGLLDAGRGHDMERLRTFAESEWCGDLCQVVGLSWVAYKRKVGELLEKYVERSRPKRLRTYELVEVLRDGKHQG